MSKKTEAFYNQLSIFYPLVDIFLRPQKRVLIREINKLPSGCLLEIGVGNGAHLPLYTKHRITGIDTSLKMLEIAAKRIKRNQSIALLQMNGEVLLFQDKAFDYVVLSHVIAVVDDPEQLLKEVFRVLKPGGSIYILNHFTPNNWLKYVDRSFSIISKSFHFKSVFYMDDLMTIKKFKLLKEIRLGYLSYFKLLIYQKK